MKRFRGCLGIALIFGLGLVVGAMLGFGVGWVGFFHKVVKGGPVAVREIIFNRAKDDLKLDYGQQEEVRLILKETSMELEKITATVRPAIEATVGKAKERIRAILTARQRARFDPFVESGWKQWRVQVVPAPAVEGEKAEPPVPAAPEKSEEGK